MKVKQELDQQAKQLQQISQEKTKLSTELSQTRNDLKKTNENLALAQQKNTELTQKAQNRIKELETKLEQAQSKPDLKSAQTQINLSDKQISLLTQQWNQVAQWAQEQGIDTNKSWNLTSLKKKLETELTTAKKEITSYQQTHQSHAEELTKTNKKVEFWKGEYQKALKSGKVKPESEPEPGKATTTNKEPINPWLLGTILLVAGGGIWLISRKNK
ncbi:hypothetical protein [endosymbiont GvMRE of Glomus versiforme]|uniref:hypothetical protein n=1 Tax=endosymbiont GvMRE of Glomus versiforme TaxID=2039283 RepID=UPI0011C440D0|nr:hypothetical protein [endosymbiont GvMRE of Glomus versiforme]